jgi:hypothetical protein
MFDHYHFAGTTDGTWANTSDRPRHETASAADDFSTVPAGSDVYGMSQYPGHDYGGYFSYDDAGDDAGNAWMSHHDSSWQALPDLHQGSFPSPSFQAAEWDGTTEAPHVPAAPSSSSGGAANGPNDRVAVGPATLCRCEECGKKFKRQEHLRRHVGRYVNTRPPRCHAPF